MTDIEGVEYRTIDGTRQLATRGPTRNDPQSADWRPWDPHRSKLAAMIELGFEIEISPGDVVLYLGAAAGTTVSHVADIAGQTYAIDFAPGPMRQLLEHSSIRENLFPLLKDARAPSSYAHVVESDIDLLIQDVATRGQIRVSQRNQQFLASDGVLILAIKARSEDVTEQPSTIYDQALDQLAVSYDIEYTGSLAPYHADHLGVIATSK